jgi:glutathione S-transferase
LVQLGPASFSASLLDVSAIVEMGAGAAAGMNAAVETASAEELKKTLNDDFKPDAKKKLAEALSGGGPKIADIKAYYSNSVLPNPMNVDFFAHEKGIKLPLTTVDFGGLVNRDEAHLKQNPAGQLPYIELTDGTIIAESIAIMEFLEEAVPEPALIGATAKERAVNRMWQRRMEEHFVYPTFTGLRFATAHEDYPEKTGGLPPFKNFFEKRVCPEAGCVMAKDAYQEMRQWGLNRLHWLENQKKDTDDEWIAGKNFSMVDIQTYTTLKFFGAAQEPCGAELEKLPWLKKWYERVEARPGCKAMLEGSKGLLW